MKYTLSPWSGSKTPSLLFAIKTLILYNRIINTFYQEMDLRGVKFNQDHTEGSRKQKHLKKIIWRLLRLFYLSQLRL